MDLSAASWWRCRAGPGLGAWSGASWSKPPSCSSATSTPWPWKPGWVLRLSPSLHRHRARSQFHYPIGRTSFQGKLKGNNKPYSILDPIGFILGMSYTDIFYKFRQNSYVNKLIMLGLAMSFNKDCHLYKVVKYDNHKVTHIWTSYSGTERCCHEKRSNESNNAGHWGYFKARVKFNLLKTILALLPANILHTSSGFKRCRSVGQGILYNRRYSDINKRTLICFKDCICTSSIATTKPGGGGGGTEGLMSRSRELLGFLLKYYPGAFQYGLTCEIRREIGMRC